MRKATFTKTSDGKYRPINKRANRLTRRRQVARKNLKKIATQGKASCYVWTNAGLRKVA